MDVLLSAALQEVAVEGTQGCTLHKLWTLLQSASPGAEMIVNERSKQLLWRELLNVPGMLLLLPSSQAASIMDPSFHAVDDAERLGLRLVAPESLRESSLGMYDLSVCDARLSKEQRNVLECIAKSRSKGITQSQLAKEFKIPGNKMFYLVKMLEVRGLVVRQATLVRTVEGNADGSNRHFPIVTTNLLHLSRYAKDLTLSSHQRFEIFNPFKDTPRDDRSLVVREGVDDGGQGSRSKKEREFIIKDDLPAMQAVCQKLEETAGKVLVVSDIKTSLGYRMAVGHRTWRRLVKRLQDAGLVEILNAQIEDKVRVCIRLVKSFDAKAFKTANDETENEVPLKCGKRGQVTDLVTELPIDQQMYNLVDRSGLTGVQMIEVFNSLGLQNKRNYYRISTMLERHLLVSEAENHKRSTLYRLKTAKNVNRMPRPSADVESHAEPTTVPPSERALVPSSSAPNESCQEIVAYQSPSAKEVVTSQRKQKGNARKALQQARMSKGNNSKQPGAEQNEMELAEIEMKVEPDCIEASAIVPHGSLNPSKSDRQAGSPVQVSFVPCDFKDTENHFSPITAVSTTRAQREKRILDKLQAEKFILRVELHRWLEEVENRKNIMMDRKTLSRMLQALQNQGHCKCVMLSMPGLTNCGRQRTTEVVLHPSVVVDPDLLSKVHDQVRKFDMVSRGHGVSRAKPKDAVPVLTGVPRMLPPQTRRVVKFDKQGEINRSMQANGYIPAKMVRVRMLHHFLWSYVNDLPDDLGLLPNGAGAFGEVVGSCKIFGLENAVQAMPLELFLQIVGSFHKIENLGEWCKQGLRLCDLPKEDFSLLYDSNSTGRLSWLVDVLRRLKLVRLVMGCGSAARLDQEGLGKSSLSAVLTYAMEREPYLEEPAPAPLSSMDLDVYDLSPRARHEFSIVNKDGLNAYWQNLEYFYSGVQPAVARHAFPGSNVPELFGLRSWAALKVMSVEQRTELLRRIGDGGIEKRRPWHECVMIAKELNLSLQQVLRVSYEKNRVYRLQTLQEAGQTAGKRKGPSEDLVEPPHVRAYKKQRHERDMTEKNWATESGQQVTAPIVGYQHIRTDDMDGEEDDDDNEGLHNDGQLVNAFSFAASARPSRPRSKRFTWSEALDRKLIIAYARRRAELGARYNRVDWDLVSDLPAPASVCRRRIAQLRLDPRVRKAINSLCTILGIRHATRMASLSAAAEKPGNSPRPAVAFIANSSRQTGLDDRQMVMSDADYSYGQECLDEESLHANSGDQELAWDDFKEPFLAAALDEVMRCRAAVKARPMSKQTRSSNSGIVAEPNGESALATETAVGDAIDVPSQAIKGHRTEDHEGAATADSSSALAAISRLTAVASLHGRNTGDETTQHNSSPMPGRSLMVAGPTRRVRKRCHNSSLRRPVGAQNVSNGQLVRKSAAMANAVELVKLVLLNSSEGTQLTGTLIQAIQRFKETEIFTAVKYLRELGFLGAGQAGQTFALSPRFFHDCSASRFPLETASEFVSGEQWIRDHSKEIEQGWVTLPSELRCGQLSYLLASAAAGELSLSASIPVNDLGELEDKRPGKRKVSALESQDYVRKIKPSSDWATLRRERGFPGIQVSVTRASRSIATILNTLKGIGDGLSEAQTTEPSDVAIVDKIDDALHISDPSGLHPMDDYGRSPLMEEPLIGTEAVFSELRALPYEPYEAPGWESNKKDVPQDTAATETSSRTGLATNPTLEDCVLHWCSDSGGTYRGSGTLLPPSPELLREAYFAIEQAGEEGLPLEKLADLVHIFEGEEESKLETVGGYVHALESFGLVNQVNAFDHVKVVESSQSARLFLQLPHKSNSSIIAQQLHHGEVLCDSGAQRQIVPCDQSSSRDSTRGFDERQGSDFDFGLKGCANSTDLAAQLLVEGPTMTPLAVSTSSDHRIIPLRPDGEANSNTQHVPILPWLDQYGAVNEHMLKGFIRRVMGIVSLHPGLSEDMLLEQINVLNPQSVRQLMRILELDGHLLVQSVQEPVSPCPPRLLRHLVAGSNIKKEPALIKHYFVNPLAGRYL